MKDFFNLFNSQFVSALHVKFDWLVCGCKNIININHYKLVSFKLMSAFHSSTFLVKTSRIKFLELNNLQHEINQKFVSKPRISSVATIDKILHNKQLSTHEIDEHKSFRAKLKSLMVKMKGRVIGGWTPTRAKDTGQEPQNKEHDQSIGPIRSASVSTSLIINVIDSNEAVSFYSVELMQNLSSPFSLSKIGGFNTIN